MKILLDTNFLVYCAKQKIDYVNEIQDLIKSKYSLVAIVQVVQELESLKDNAKKFSDKQAAVLALKMLDSNKVKIIKAQGRTADSALINLNKGNIIATIDKNLQKKLNKIIIIRGKKKLALK